MAEPTILLLSTSDTDLISARSSGKNYRWANPSRLADDELADLLAAVHASLRELADVITETQLALPGGMQPLWGGDERRVMPA